MKPDTLTRFGTGVYLVSFFTFLLGPLLVMGISAFNTPAYPQVWPIEGTTLRWFGELFSVQKLQGPVAILSSLLSPCS